MLQSSKEVLILPSDFFAPKSRHQVLQSLLFAVDSTANGQFRMLNPVSFRQYEVELVHDKSAVSKK